MRRENGKIAFETLTQGGADPILKVMIWEETGTSHRSTNWSRSFSVTRAKVKNSRYNSRSPYSRASRAKHPHMPTEPSPKVSCGFGCLDPRHRSLLDFPIHPCWNTCVSNLSRLAARCVLLSWLRLSCRPGAVVRELRRYR